MKFLIPEFWNICSKLSCRKLFNAAKLYTSFQISKISRNPVHWGKPLSITIEPTTACNLKCPECPSGLRSFSRPVGSIDVAKFRDIVDSVADHLIYLVFYFQGEPFIHPQFLEMVEYARFRKIYTISSTNGHFLDDNTAKKTIDSGLDRLVISVDGTTQEVYEKYRRGGNLEKVLQGTRNLVKWKKAMNSKIPHIIFQFLVVRPNEHQIEDFSRLAQQLGVDEVKFKTAQIYDHKNGNPLIPIASGYSRYEKNDNGEFEIKNRLKNQCWKMWHSCVITWDGKLLPCCFDKDGHHILGDVNQDKIEDIWAGKISGDFRIKLHSGRKNIDICQNCSEGCKVWA